MAWVDGVDLATGTLVTGAIWNNYNGAAGSLMQVKSHAHGGVTGEGSQSIGPLALGDFTDAAAPAAPGAGKTRLYTVTGKPRFRAGAAGADTALIDAVTAAAGDLAGTYPSPTVKGITLGSDADGDIYYRSGGVLTRLPKGTALYLLRMNAGGTAPEWAGGTPVQSLDSSTVNANFADNVERTLYTFTIPAGTFAAGEVLRFTAWGRHVSTLGGGAAPTVTLRFKLGATTFLAKSDLNANFANTTLQWAVRMEFSIIATNSQRGLCWVWFTPAGAPGLAMDVITAAEDLTAAKAFAITTQQSATTAGLVTHFDGNALERIP